MSKILFIWNIASTDGNIGSYRPSVYAAKSIGFDIDIAMNFSSTPEDKKKWLEDTLGINLINVNFERNPFSLKNFKAYKQLIEVMENGKYDIIHCNTPVGSILGRLAAYKIGHRRVFYMNRGFAFYKGAPLKNWLFYYNIEKFFARFFTDAIATINPTDFEYAQKFDLRGGSQLRYSLPGPGVELSRFEYNNDSRKMIRTQYGISDNDIVVLSVGDLIERKNFLSIITALATNILKNRQIYYVIVGNGVLENTLHQKAKEYNIEDRVIFVGYREDVSEFYSAADIYALPSLNEGFGRVGIEAMNCGLPLITSDVQGINLYSIDGETGFKCSPKDVNSYAEGILRLAQDGELRKKIGEHNKAFAQKFSMENSGNEIAKIYIDMMEKI